MYLKFLDDTYIIGFGRDLKQKAEMIWNRKEYNGMKMAILVPEELPHDVDKFGGLTIRELEDGEWMAVLHDKYQTNSIMKSYGFQPMSRGYRI